MCMAHGILSERVGCYVGKRSRMGREGEKHHAEAGRPTRRGGKREEKGKRKRRRKPGQTDGLGQLGQARKKEESMRSTAGPGCCWAVGPVHFLYFSLNQMLVMSQSNFGAIFSLFLQAIYLFFKCVKFLQNK